MMSFNDVLMRKGHSIYSTTMINVAVPCPPLTFQINFINTKKLNFLQTNVRDFIEELFRNSHTVVNINGNQDIWLRAVWNNSISCQSSWELIDMLLSDISQRLNLEISISLHEFLGFQIRNLNDIFTRC